MKITVDGTAYDFDSDQLSVREAFVIFDQTKMTITAWQQGLGEGNPYAMAALVFLLKRRAGEQVDWTTLDFNLSAIEVEGDDAEADASDPSSEPEQPDAA